MQKEVEQMIDRFLEYVMENHQVNKERASILQALQISVVSTYFTMYCFNLICHALEWHNQPSLIYAAKKSQKVDLSV